MEDKDINDAIVEEYHEKKRKVVTDKHDYIIDTIFSKLQDKEIILDPEYQRNFVWDESKSSQLIESILLGIPIPTIYLNEGSEDDEVIDGQQRLTTIYSYMRGLYPDNNVFKLKGLQELSCINGLTYEQLPKSLKKSLRDFNITIIKIKSASHSDTKFDIFERLNKGSENLKEQELRNCVYRGPFNNELHMLVNHEKVKRFFTEKEHKKLCKRMDLQADICSYFSAHKNKGVFSGNPGKKESLNITMSKLNNDPNAVADIKSHLFKSLDMVYSILGDKAFHKKVNVRDSIVRYSFSGSLFMTITSFFSDFEKNQVFNNADSIRKAFERLMTEDEEFISTLTSQTTAPSTLRKRFMLLERDLLPLIEYKEDRFFSKDVKEYLFIADNTCKICNNKILNIDDAHVDHIIPFSQGGKTVFENAQLAHKYCNIIKG